MTFLITSQRSHGTSSNNSRSWQGPMCCKYRHVRTGSDGFRSQTSGGRSSTGGAERRRRRAPTDSAKFPGPRSKVSELQKVVRKFGALILYTHHQTLPDMPQRIAIWHQHVAQHYCNLAATLTPYVGLSDPCFCLLTSYFCLVAPHCS